MESKIRSLDQQLQREVPNDSGIKENWRYMSGQRRCMSDGSVGQRQYEK